MKNCRGLFLKAYKNKLKKNATRDHREAKTHFQNQDRKWQLSLLLLLPQAEALQRIQILVLLRNSSSLSHFHKISNINNNSKNNNNSNNNNTSSNNINIRNSNNKNQRPALLLNRLHHKMASKPLFKNPLSIVRSKPLMLRIVKLRKIR
jgi:hypothetical protein